MNRAELHKAAIRRPQTAEEAAAHDADVQCIRGEHSPDIREVLTGVEGRVIHAYECSWCRQTLYERGEN